MCYVFRTNVCRLMAYLPVTGSGVHMMEFECLLWLPLGLCCVHFSGC